MKKGNLWCDCTVLRPFRTLRLLDGCDHVKTLFQMNWLRMERKLAVEILVFNTSKIGFDSRIPPQQPRVTARRRWVTPPMHADLALWLLWWVPQGEGLEVAYKTAFSSIHQLSRYFYVLAVAICLKIQVVYYLTICTKEGKTSQRIEIVG